MSYSLPRMVLTCVLACVAAGCANVGTGSRSHDKVSPDTQSRDSKDPDAKSQVDRSDAPKLSQERLMLSEGYSILYRDAGNFDLAKLILYVKSESDAVEKVVKEVAEFGDQLKKDLERIAKDYPGVRIDLDPLPEMEKRKRTAISVGRAKYFAPIVGKGGREYERTVLIGYSNGLNHERHLCKVMAEAEPDAGLKKFLLDTEKRYEVLYERVMTLLENEYFKNPNGKTKE
jgi:hypothetical protein